MRHHPSVEFVLLCCFLARCGTGMAADDWPQFRGPAGQGHALATELPTIWNETKNVVWKVPLPGRGWSSPVIWGDQIWVTTALATLVTPEEKKRRLAGNQYEATLALADSVSLRALCIHRDTGELLHNIEMCRADQPDPIHQLNSYATPTPVLDGKRLYCDFGTYGTTCVQTQSATTCWSRRLPIDHQVGPGSSPLQFRNLLILVRDGCDVQYVTALDKQSGETVWKTNRPPIDLDEEFRKGFSTPILINHHTQSQIVVPGAKWVVAYAPESGRPIWRVNYVKGYSNVARPVYGHGMVFVCTNGPGRQLWAIRIDGSGDVTDTHVVWRVKKQVAYRVSPLLVDQELYVVTDQGVITCLDALTGSVHWNLRLGGNHAASPIYADGKIYVFGEDGSSFVLRPGTHKPAGRPIENRLNGRFVASPAVAGSGLFLRSATHLYRICDF